MTPNVRKVSGSLVLAVAVAWAIATAAAGDESTGMSGARIHIENKRHDFGDVYERDAFIHTFEVKNIGTENLLIETVRTSCGCTVAEFDSIIAPGQVGKITLNLDGSKVNGTFTKSATVRSNDPDHPSMSVSLGGNILEYISIEPERVYLRGMHGEAVERELTITAHEQGTDFEILGISSNVDDKITYRVEPSTEAGVYKVKIFKNPKLTKINTWGSLHIATNNEHTPDKVVQVNVITPGSIVVSPSIVDFGKVDNARLMGAERIEKEIMISKANGDFSIKEITFSSNHYKAKVEPLDGRSYRVIVGFRPDSKDLSYSDEMVISTDDPLEPALRVRLIARGG